MFNFSDSDSKTFQYSKGERDDTGQFKIIFGDPARLKRQLAITIPNKNALIDQHAAGAAIVRARDAEAAAYDEQRQADPTLPAKVFGFTDEELATIRAGSVAYQNVCTGTRAAFGLLDFDEATGQGCTDSMVVHVLNSFAQWLEEN